MSTAARVSPVLSVVMPVFNEEKLVAGVIERVLAQPAVAELIIVDDASTDGTSDALQSFARDARVRVFRQKHNCGKGAALIEGFARATCDFVVVQDADWEYDPADFDALLAPLLAGRADVVYGSRLLGNPDLVFGNRTANVVLTKLFNFFSGLRLTDMETCYKMFRREIVQKLILTSPRFGIEVEIGAKLAKIKNLRLVEVPISYAPRKRDEGKKISWRDGVAALWHIVRFNWLTSRRRSLKS